MIPEGSGDSPGIIPAACGDLSGIISELARGSTGIKLFPMAPNAIVDAIVICRARDMSDGLLFYSHRKTQNVFHIMKCWTALHLIPRHGKP
jgi:hypothetical protein